MPPKAVRTLSDLIYWQYAKIISESAGFGKENFGFIMNRYRKLKSGEIEWSSSIREWLREKESPDRCIYCGSMERLTVDHMIPASRGGPTTRITPSWCAATATRARVTGGSTSSIASAAGTRFRG
jgi:hypothetical protein